MKTEKIALIALIDSMCAEKNISLRPMHAASDIMTSNVKTLTLDHTIRSFLKFMDFHKVRHALVVDNPVGDEKEPYFVGVISQRDVLRLNVPMTGDGGREKVDQRALRQLLTQAVTRDPKFVSPDTPIPEVISTMISNHIDMVPVLVDKKPVGIITTTDLLKLYAKIGETIQRICPQLKKKKKADIRAATGSAEKTIYSWFFQAVTQVMTTEVVSLEEADNLGSAMKIMQEGEFRHVPVTDEQGKLLGIVSDRDILRHLPFAGKRPPGQPRYFREYLFKIDAEAVDTNLPVERIMTRKVKCVLPSCTVLAAAKTQHSMKISDLLVVNKAKKLCGTVTITNLLQELLNCYEATDDR